MKSLSVKDLVAAIYPSKQSDPANWLIEVATQDAEQRGLGKWDGFFKKQFEVQPAYFDKLREEASLLYTANNKLGQDQATIIDELSDEIEMGIRSRENRTVVVGGGGGP